MKLIPIFFAVLLMLGGNAWAAVDADIAMTITPVSVTPGNDGFISLVVSNNGLASVDAKITSLSIDTPLTLGSYSRDLGKIAKTSSTSSLIKFTVPASTVSGFYKASMSVDVCEGSVCTSYAKDAIITVQSPSYIAIESITPKNLKAGEIQKLRLVISNEGSTSINNVRVSWADASGNIIPYGTDNTAFISSIGGNAKNEVEMDVVVSPAAVQGIYTLTFTITYNDQTGAQQSTAYTTGITVSGDYNFIVTLDEQDILVPGKIGEITVKVANGGSQDAQFLVLSLEEDGVINQINPTISYIGTLESDDFDTQDFTVKIGQVTPGMHAVKVNMEYKDIYGQFYNETYDIKVRVVSAAEAGNGQDPTGTVVIIVLLVIIGYLLYRRRKKKK